MLGNLANGSMETSRRGTTVAKRERNSTTVGIDRGSAEDFVLSRGT